MASIDELVEAAKKVLDKFKKQITERALYLIVSGDKFFCWDYKKFLDRLNKTPEVNHQIIFGNLYNRFMILANNIYTIILDSAKR